jgi:hypothetical protein
MATRLHRGKDQAHLPAQVIGATPEHLTAEHIPVIDLSWERLTDPRTHPQIPKARVMLAGDPDA